MLAAPLTAYRQLGVHMGPRNSADCRAAVPGLLSPGGWAGSVAQVGAHSVVVRQLQLAGRADAEELTVRRVADATPSRPGGEDVVGGQSARSTVTMGTKRRRGEVHELLQGCAIREVDQHFACAYPLIALIERDGGLEVLGYIENRVEVSRCRRAGGGFKKGTADAHPTAARSDQESGDHPEPFGRNTEDAYC